MNKTSYIQLNKHTNFKEKLTMVILTCLTFFILDKNNIYFNMIQNKVYCSCPCW